MPWRSTVIAMILAIAGIAAVLWQGLPTLTTSRIAAASRTAAASVIPPRTIPVDAVNRITLHRAAENVTFDYSRTGAHWAQTHPFAHPVDPWSMRQFVLLASELESFDTVEGDADSGRSTRDAQLAAMHLSPPLAVLTLEWPGGSLTLELGRRTVAGRAYLRVAGHTAVHVVNHQLHQRAIEDDPREWRDRTLFHSVGIDLARIEWSQPASALASTGPMLAIERTNATGRAGRAWSMIAPVATRVDPAAVEAWLAALASAQLAGFILDQPTEQELARFGLVTPAATLAITGPHPQTSQSSPTQSTAAFSQRLHIGARMGGGTQDHFGVIEGRDVVVRIPAAALAALFKTPAAVAQPTASGINPADVKTITIRSTLANGGSEFTIERDLERWRAPQHARAEVNRAHVEQVLHTLTTLRAPSVEFKPYPRHLEVATITFYGFDSRPLDTVRIARQPTAAVPANANGNANADSVSADSSNDPPLQWIFENGDNVLRIHPASLQLRLTPADFNLASPLAPAPSPPTSAPDT